MYKEWAFGWALGSGMAEEDMFRLLHRNVFRIHLVITAGFSSPRSLFQLDRGIAVLT